MEYTISQKNKRVIIFDGFRYRHDRTSKRGRESWRCVKAGCRGRLIIDGEAKKVNKQHNHAPNLAENHAVLIKQQIKSMAKNTEEKPRDILRATTSGLSAEQSVQAPSYEAVKKIIHRARNGGKENIIAPGNPLELKIPEKLQQTDRGEKFLMWDSGSVGEKILIFTTYSNLSLLNEFPHWSVDGTFSVAPQCFMQVFTIHALIDSKAAPMIYVLLESKREDSYKTVFNKILEFESTLQPSSFLCDFELACINALTSCFHNCTIVGCFFHLSQNLWRKIQEFRLTDLYKSQETFRTQVKMLLALSFVPEKDVQFGFEIISEDFPEEIKPISDYWEKTYIGRRLLNLQPRYSIKMWNLFERLKEDLPRTNNSLEAWHRVFQNSVDCHHPSILKLVEKFIKEQGNTELFVNRYRAGYRRKIGESSKYVQLTRRLNTLADEYSFRRVKEYLQAVSLNLSL